MLLRILGWIPLLQCLAFFPWNAHKSALKKFLALWTLTSLPILLAAIISPIPEGEMSVAAKLFTKISESISVSELFVYTASFLTPILYVFYEKHESTPKNRIGEKLAQGVKSIFKGYGLVTFFSFLTMLSTAVAFSFIKSDIEIFRRSFLNHYLTNLSFPIYIFSLYCWYLTLLDGVWGGNFVDLNRRTENSVSSQFSARLRTRESSDE